MAHRAILLIVLILAGVAAGAPVRLGRDAATFGHAKHVGHTSQPGVLARALRGGREDWALRPIRAIVAATTTPPVAARAGIRDFAAVRVVDTSPGHWGASHLTL